MLVSSMKTWISYKDHIWFLWFHTRIVLRNRVWSVWNHIWFLYEIKETSTRDVIQWYWVSVVSIASGGGGVVPNSDGVRGCTVSVIGLTAVHGSMSYCNYPGLSLSPLSLIRTLQVINQPVVLGLKQTQCYFFANDDCQLKSISFRTYMLGLTTSWSCFLYLLASYHCLFALLKTLLRALCACV